MLSASGLVRVRVRVKVRVRARVRARVLPTMRAVELSGTEPLHAVALPPADAWLYCLVGLVGWTVREGTRRHSQVALVRGACPPHRYFIRLAARLTAAIELCLRAQT